MRTKDGFINARSLHDVWKFIYGRPDPDAHAHLVLICESGTPDIITPANNVYLGYCSLADLSQIASEDGKIVSAELTTSRRPEDKSEAKLTGATVERLDTNVCITIASGDRKGKEIAIEHAEFRRFVDELIEDHALA